MKYLTIIKTSRGFGHFFSPSPERLCEELNNTGDLQDFSIVGIGAEPIETLKIEDARKEFDRGYNWAKKAISNGQSPYDLLEQQRGVLNQKEDFDKGWEAACVEAIESEFLSKTSLPDLSLEEIGVNRTIFLPGKWYKSGDSLAVYGGQTYGFFNKIWVSKKAFVWSSSRWQPASNEEIQKVLVDEAWRRYDGKLILIQGERAKFNDLTVLKYIPVRNSLVAYHEAFGAAIDLFCDGEWVKYDEMVKEVTFNLDVAMLSEDRLLKAVDQISKELLNRRK